MCLDVGGGPPGPSVVIISRLCNPLVHFLGFPDKQENSKSILYNRQGTPLGHPLFTLD